MKIYAKTELDIPEKSNNSDLESLNDVYWDKIEKNGMKKNEKKNN